MATLPSSPILDPPEDDLNLMAEGVPPYMISYWRMPKITIIYNLVSSSIENNSLKRKI